MLAQSDWMSVNVQDDGRCMNSSGLPRLRVHVCKRMNYEACNLHVTHVVYIRLHVYMYLSSCCPNAHDVHMRVIRCTGVDVRQG